MAKSKKSKWNGLCEAQLHGKDFESQPCDMCARENQKSLWDRINDGDFVVKGESPYLIKDVKERADAVKAHREKQNALHAEFYAAVLDDLDLTKHPKAGKLMSIAWDMGHAYGYMEVYNHAVTLAELLKD